MNSYDDDTLRAINENADLFAYVSQTLELEQRGGDWYDQHQVGRVFHRRRLP